MLENYVPTSKEDDWIECVKCRNWPLVFCSAYKDKFVDFGRKLLTEKIRKMPN